MKRTAVVKRTVVVKRTAVVKRAVCVALVVGAIFVSHVFPGHTLRRMKVTYVSGETVSLVDSSGEVYVIYADGLEVGDSLLCYCAGNHEELRILDYHEVTE